MNAADAALVDLGRALRRGGYEFVTVTPESHARVIARANGDREARNARDVFGWSLPFQSSLLEAPFLTLAERAGVLVRQGALLRSRVRFSTVAGNLCVHSAFPTEEADSVFLGPDTYRFCSWIARSLEPCATVVDVGCGSGAGGLVAARMAGRVVLGDVNGLALRYARVNAAIAGIEAEVLESDILARVEGPVTAVLANPPYLVDEAKRTYRDGGGAHGDALALRIVQESLARLEPGGQLVLYTGACVVAGVDVFRRAVEPLCRELDASLVYEELDPDVFGNELSGPAYRDVERIAAVGLTCTRLPVQEAS